MMNVSLAWRHSDTWAAALRFVRHRYDQAFDADANPDPDCFIVAGRTPAQMGGTFDVRACAGLTFASDRPFPSECDLDAPVDVEIFRRLGDTVDRKRVVEVGALASEGNRIGAEVIRLIPIISWCQGMSYILCTVTGRLARTLETLRIALVPLGPAQLERVAPDERERWGRYYDHDPYTGAIPLNAIAPLFADCTGRCVFSDLQVALPQHAPESLAASATG